MIQTSRRCSRTFCTPLPFAWSRNVIIRLDRDQADICPKRRLAGAARWTTHPWWLRRLSNGRKLIVQFGQRFEGTGSGKTLPRVEVRCQVSARLAPLAKRRITRITKRSAPRQWVQLLDMLAKTCLGQSVAQQCIRSLAPTPLSHIVSRKRIRPRHHVD